MDRSILCNCDIEAKSHFLLESLAACGEQENENSDLEMYFTVNLAFANYLDQLDETINVPIERNWIHQLHVLPISIEPFQMSQNLMQTPKTLKDYINQYQENRRSLNMKEKKIKEPTFNTFLSSHMVDVILFVTGIPTVILTFIIMYTLCGQPKLKSIVVNLALQHVKTVEAATIKESNNCNLELIQLLIMLKFNINSVVSIGQIKEK